MRLRRTAVTGALALALLVPVSTTGCAEMPVSGPVAAGGTGVTPDDAVGMVASGPTLGADPEAIVRGFLLAAQAGPTATAPFATAKEYLTRDAALRWLPDAQVTLFEGPTSFSVEAVGPVNASVRVAAQAVARVDRRGTYTEKRFPQATEFRFEVVRDGEEWRIANLNDGVLISAQVFSSTFRRTPLFFPTLDAQYWVPDVRWFPQQTWRTNAVNELFAGPPSWLAGAVAAVGPAGITLTLQSVVVEADRSVQVRVGERLANVEGRERGLLQAQLDATLSGGLGEHRVVLVDPNGPVPVPQIERPRFARTTGQAFAYSEDKLWRVSGEDLVPADRLVDFDGLLELIGREPEPPSSVLGPTVPSRSPQPTAPSERTATPDPSGSAEPPSEAVEGAAAPLASPEMRTGPEDATEGTLPGSDPGNGEPVAEPPTGPEPPAGRIDEPTALAVSLDLVPQLVMRLGTSQLVTVANPVVSLLEGEDLVSPTFDRFGAVWTAERLGSIKVVWPTGTTSSLLAEWLDGREIESLRVAPDGARLAIVSRGADGTRINVTGIRRDEAGVPAGLNPPIIVGASVHEVSEAVWQDDAVLAVVGLAEGEKAILWVGVGGLASPGGLPRHIAGLDQPHGLTAAVGTGNMLAIDSVGRLHWRQASTLWPKPVAAGQVVNLVAYPG